MKMRDRIIARLPADEAAWLASRLPVEGASDRDAAVIEALALFPGPRTAAAKHLERALDVYFEHHWEADRGRGGPPADDRRSSALYRLAFCNDGKRLRWRRISDIAAIAGNSAESCN